MEEANAEANLIDPSDDEDDFIETRILGYVN